MFLLLNGVGSPYPVLETQVLVLVPQVLVLVTKVLVNITGVDTQTL